MKITITISIDSIIMFLLFIIIILSIRFNRWQTFYAEKAQRFIWSDNKNHS